MRAITLTFLCFCPRNCYFQASNSFSLINESHTMDTSIHIRLIRLSCLPAASTPWSASGCSDELAEVKPSLCVLSVEKRGFVFIRCVLSQIKTKQNKTKQNKKKQNKTTQNKTKQHHAARLMLLQVFPKRQLPTLKPSQSPPRDALSRRSKPRVDRIRLQIFTEK
jgi:hypothetical protein